MVIHVDRYISKITGMRYLGEPTWMYSEEDKALSILFRGDVALTVFNVEQKLIKGVFDNALKTAFVRIGSG